MKRFKGRKRKKHKLLKIIICLFIVYFTYQFTVKYLFNIKLESSNEEFILSMLNDSNHHITYNNKTSFIDKFIKNILKIDISSPNEILESVFHYKTEKNFEEEDPYDGVVTYYISDPDDTNITNPIVYIYNTHQLESYNLENYKEYNITPNVQMASYLLKGLLNKENINTIVETANINDFLSLNGWGYSASYKASRYYIEEALRENPNLELLIDLHRDALSKEQSTVTIGDKKYAKVLFVVGTDYVNYEQNLELANTLNNLIIKNYPTLSRGVITKGGVGVNGIYNQDLSNKIVLIECGGNENTIDEVMNTILVLKDVIKKYLEE